MRDIASGAPDGAAVDGVTALVPAEAAVTAMDVADSPLAGANEEESGELYGGRSPSWSAEAADDDGGAPILDAGDERVTYQLPDAEVGDAAADDDEEEEHHASPASDDEEVPEAADADAWAVRRALGGRTCCMAYCLTHPPCPAFSIILGG